MTKPSEYSDESRLEVRPAHSKYLFVYPFVKTREWYGIDPKERWRIMQEHIRVGREYPSIDLNTSYSFGLDDQEFVVAFEGDEPAVFLDLVQRLRTTEASAYTKRDTPTFTCVAMSVERALNALDGAALHVTAYTASSRTPPRSHRARSARCAVPRRRRRRASRARPRRRRADGLRRTSLEALVVALALPAWRSPSSPRELPIALVSARPSLMIRSIPTTSAMPTAIDSAREERAAEGLQRRGQRDQAGAGDARGALGGQDHQAAPARSARRSPCPARSPGR